MFVTRGSNYEVQGGCTIANCAIYIHTELRTLNILCIYVCDTRIDCMHVHHRHCFCYNPLTSNNPCTLYTHSTITHMQYNTHSRTLPLGVSSTILGWSSVDDDLTCTVIIMTLPLSVPTHMQHVGVWAMEGDMCVVQLYHNIHTYLNIQLHVNTCIFMN